jgi:hypothetical protein
MKKQSIIYCFLLFISSTLFAQTINHYNELGGGWIGSDPEDDTYIEGTRNLYDDFRPGVVYYNDNSDALQVSLRLNLYNDEFEYVNNDTLHVLKDLNHLEKIVMDNQVFIWIEPYKKANISGYVVRWNDEYPTIITKMQMGYFSGGVDMYTSKPPRFERKEDKHYIMNSYHEFERIYSVKKLIKYLGTHQQELSDFAKKEKISDSSPEELAKLLDFYHELGQDL